MDTTGVIQLIVLIALLALSFFFSSAETALTTVSPITLATLADEGNKKAATALRVRSDSQKMLSAILIGNNIVNLSASSIATTLAIRLLGDYGAGIATGVLTFLILIFGEITPKNLATIRSTQLALAYSKTILGLMTILTPVIFIINKISLGVLRLFGIKKDESNRQMTEEELRKIVDVSHESGVIEEDEKDYIHNVFDFSDASAKEIMIPRIDMTTVNVTWSYEKLMSIFSEHMFTRIPVYRDQTDNIIGILNMKDLLLIDPDKGFSIDDYLREPYFTYEQKNTAELFDEMRQNSISMAIVLDEYGAVAGMITLEDLLEELVGEIRDEYDSYEVDDIIQTADNEYEVQGQTNLDDVSDALGLHFESEDYDTIGGYLTGLFDHFPTVGETYVTKDGILLTAAAVGHKRIEKVRIRLPEPPEEETSSGEEEKSDPTPHTAR